MHLDDPRDGADRGAHVVQADAGGRRLEQDIDSLPHELHRARDDDDGDESGDDGIDLHPPGGTDDQARDHHPDRREGVPEDVHARAPDVEALVLLRQDAEGREVRDEPDQGDPGHEAALDRDGLEETAERLVEEAGRDDDQERPVDERGQDLESVVPVRLLRCRRKGGEAHRHETEDQGEKVGQHVPGVGDERQASGNQTAHRLDEKDHAAQSDNQTELSPLGRPGLERAGLAAHRRRPRARAEPSSTTMATA